MNKGKVKDITVEVLISIRDEIKKLREDTNARFAEVDKRFEQIDKRFEQIDKRFEQMDKRLEHIEADMSRWGQVLNLDIGYCGSSYCY